MSDTSEASAESKGAAETLRAAESLRAEPAGAAESLGALESLGVAESLSAAESLGALEPSRAALRLRSGGASKPFHVVLVEPEIPPNTGNIARLCGATQSVLHLVGKLGFRIDEQAVRRAGLDYWHLVDVRTHETLAAATDAIRAAGGGRRWLLSGKAPRSIYDVSFEPGDLLVFGKESVGLDPALLDAHPGECLGIPTIGAVRSLNLANAASITLYEALRQVGALTHSELR